MMYSKHHAAFRKLMASCLVLLCISTSLISCRTSCLPCRNKNLVDIDSSFHARINNNAAGCNTKIYGSPDLSSIFRLDGPIHDTVDISFTNHHELVVRYQSVNGNMEKKFKGTFDRKGRFVFYHSKKRLEIPPFIAIIYSRVNWERVRISLTPDRKFVHIHRKWDHSGNILILGAGNIGSYRAVFNIF